MASSSRISTTRSAVVFAAFALAVAKLLLFRNNTGDGTAQGVAKVRHIESMYDESVRLYTDPYAKSMYQGSSVVEWMGISMIDRLLDVSFPGILELLTLRTKWIDDQIAIHVVGSDDETDSSADATAIPSCRQLIILGAGYDTRGFRLDFFPEGFEVIEVDQSPVQASKKRILEDIATNDHKVASRLKNGMVTFVPIDFNNSDDDVGGHSIGKKLGSFFSTEGGDQTMTVVLLEGVTQYIPKSATARTLKQLHELLPRGSVLLVSYVPQTVFDDDTDRVSRLVLKGASLVGEPWISVWTRQGFASFLLSECGGYQVVSDSGVRELHEQYLAPLATREKDLPHNRRSRNMRNQVPPIERYVVARVV